MASSSKTVASPAAVLARGVPSYTIILEAVSHLILPHCVVSTGAARASIHFVILHEVARILLAVQVNSASPAVQRTTINKWKAQALASSYRGKAPTAATAQEIPAGDNLIMTDSVPPLPSKGNKPNVIVQDPPTRTSVFQQLLVFTSSRAPVIETANMKAAATTARVSVFN